jgi:hypothetical protein
MYTATLTVDQVIDALKAFLTPFMQGGTVARAQVNRVPLPSNPCCILTELRQSDLSAPATRYQPSADTATIYGPSMIVVQADFYGQQSGEFCKVSKTAFRSEWGFNQFVTGIRPLYTSDGMQTPLLTGEEQYESRWTLEFHLQYNPTVVVPQQFADEASVATLDPADIFVSA